MTLVQKALVLGILRHIAVIGGLAALPLLFG